MIMTDDDYDDDNNGNNNNSNTGDNLSIIHVNFFLLSFTICQLKSNNKWLD